MESSASREHVVVDIRAFKVLEIEGAEGEYEIWVKQAGKGHPIGIKGNQDGNYLETTQNNQAFHIVFARGT